MLPLILKTASVVACRIPVECVDRMSLQIVFRRVSFTPTAIPGSDRLTIIHLRRSRDCRWMFVDLFVAGFVVALNLLILGSCYTVHINALSI